MTALFFDLDGTLTNPKPGIVGSIRYALDKLGVDSRDDLDWCIGPPLQVSFAKLVGHARVDEAIGAYRERFGDVGLFENAVYEGIPELLATLREREIALYVATSKPHLYANRILEHFDLSQHFLRVFGAEMDGTRANKADLLAYALLETGIKSEDAVMIGDREHDVIGGVANGMETVGVLWGYGGRDELASAGAGRIVASIAELGDQFAI